MPRRYLERIERQARSSNDDHPRLRSRNRMRSDDVEKFPPSLYPFPSQSRVVALWSLLKWSATPWLRLYNRFPKLRPLELQSGCVWRTDRNCRFLCLKHWKTCFESTSLTRPPISVETRNRDFFSKVPLSNRTYEILLNIRFLWLYVSAFSICEEKIGRNCWENVRISR